jgi:hypothetical protein
VNARAARHWLDFSNSQTRNKMRLHSAVKVLVVLAISPIGVCAWFWGFKGAVVWAAIMALAFAAASRAGWLPNIEDDDLLCLPEDNWG